MRANNATSNERTKFGLKSAILRPKTVDNFAKSNKQGGHKRCRCQDKYRSSDVKAEYLARASSNHEGNVLNDEWHSSRGVEGRLQPLRPPKDLRKA